MRRSSLSAALLLMIVAAAACDSRPGAAAQAVQNAELTKREARLDQALTAADSAGKPEAMLALWKLPAALREISGLALASDGRLFVHGDERAKVWEINYRNGTIVKEFSVGVPPVIGDMESIAIVGDAMFLLNSRGKLHRFREGANGANVVDSPIDTGLGDVCELEGMASDPATKSLLLACKLVFARALQDSLVIFRWKVDGETARGLDLPRITVPQTRAVGGNPWKALHPSDITVDPRTGDFVLVAGQEEALLEITPAGVVVLSRPLPGKHNQAEGVAITKDGVLLVSDEGGKGAGAIALYRWPLAHLP